VIEQWIGWWRDVLLVQNGESARVTNIDHPERLHEHAARFRLAEIQRALQSLRTTARYLTQNVNARLALEVLLLELPGKS
jgi:DNA polymerase III gamma/tau subunit